MYNGGGNEQICLLSITVYTLKMIYGTKQFMNNCYCCFLSIASFMSSKPLLYLTTFFVLMSSDAMFLRSVPASDAICQNLCQTSVQSAHRRLVSDSTGMYSFVLLH